MARPLRTSRIVAGLAVVLGVLVLGGQAAQADEPDINGTYNTLWKQTEDCRDTSPEAPPRRLLPPANVTMKVARSGSSVTFTFDKKSYTGSIDQDLNFDVEFPGVSVEGKVTERWPFTGHFTVLSGGGVTFSGQLVSSPCDPKTGFTGRAVFTIRGGRKGTERPVTPPPPPPSVTPGFTSLFTPDMRKAIGRRANCEEEESGFLGTACAEAQRVGGDLLRLYEEATGGTQPGGPGSIKHSLFSAGTAGALETQDGKPVFPTVRALLPAATSLAVAAAKAQRAGRTEDVQLLAIYLDALLYHAVKADLATPAPS